MSRATPYSSPIAEIVLGLYTEATCVDVRPDRNPDGGAQRNDGAHREYRRAEGRECDSVMSPAAYSLSRPCPQPAC
jgi:hypothetical protein